MAWDDPVPGSRAAKVCAPRPRRLFVPLVVAWALLTDASVARAQVMEPPLCLDLSLTPWAGTSELGGDSIFYAPPPRVLLDTLPAGPGPESKRHLLREAPGSLPSVHRHSTWHWSADRDTLHMVWSTGFAGLGAALGREGSVSRGRARTFSDNLGAPRFVAEMTAETVDCGSEPPLTLAHLRPVPTGIRLQAGDSVALGMRVREVPGVESTEGRQTVVLRCALAQPFAEATEVELITDEEGIIGIIRFRLPDESDFGTLVQLFVAEYGPPTNRSHRTIEGSELELVGWTNRVVSFNLSRYRRPGEAWYVGALLSLWRFDP